MYQEHAPTIQAYAQAHPDNLARVMQFVVLTVQTPLQRAVGDIETAAQGGADARGILYGWKLEAYNVAWNDRHAIVFNLLDIWEGDTSERHKTDEMLSYLTTIHGFGLAKGGFVLQLCFGLSACLDTHNIKRFGLPARGFDNIKQRKTATARRAMITRYNDTVEALGGTEQLWDGWCQHVAAVSRNANSYTCADHVSRLHCEAFNLEGN